MEPFLGEVQMFGGNFAPRGWAFCEGQLLEISKNSALFSILGTTYGGDGRTMFALPDMRDRAAVGEGSGPGLSDVRLGEMGGFTDITMSIQNMPSHTHSATLNAVEESVERDTAEPEGAYLGGTSPTCNSLYVANPVADDWVAMASGSIELGASGNGQSHNNMQPWIATSWIIALQGVYPSRS